MSDQAVDAPSEPPGRKRSTIALWALGALVAVALVTGAVLGALRSPAALEPNSPEGVVQAYLQAVLEGEYEQAVAYLSGELAERCDLSHFRDAYVQDSLTATLEDVRTVADDTEVLVRLRPGAEPAPFGGSGYSFTETFVLVDEDGAWRLADPPWPLHFCPERP